jgi:putative ABC transport system permease protein
VLRTVIVETFVVGALASLLGLGLGFVLAQQLSALFGALGLALPEAGTVVAARTVIVSLTVGVIVTLLAGLIPAIRATRVAPIAAVREGSVAPTTRFNPYVGGISLLVLAIAAGILGLGLFGPGLSVQQRLLSMGLGSLVAFFGVAMVAPRLVRPLAAVVGAPAARLGVAGSLARRNADRHPGRTAATAAALMIGLTLVTTVAVLGQGLRTSARDTVERQVTADYVVTSENGFDGMPPTVGQQIASVPGIEATSVRSDKAKAFGSSTVVTGVEADVIGKVYGFRFSEGGDDAVAALDRGGAIVRRSYAEKHDLHAGSPLRIVSPSGQALQLRVSGLLDHGKFDLDPLLGSIVISQSRFDAAFPRPTDLYTFVSVPAGTAVSDEMLAAGVERFPGAKVLTRAEFVDERSKGIGQILNLLYVLLALSVVVSLFGMINTLVLAVFERTRELGMLRAIGLTRRQTRRMVRHESVITALIGAALGLPLGIGLAAAVTQALGEYDISFSLPTGTLVAFVAVAVVAGIVAAIVPARRASRLDVLEALGYE